ncbi:uncharacterized protein LOC118753053 [Rhagoletis pomonella]|uniref:uncharacterized protein LOC118753018 n=1 Tax=Rhagoletis pomonella TaxID=28610 RepID=UPI001783FBCA|nr:uncharacterized protein LOC118753018 [Rhagoletis pomonella]XP_036343795.1 uncharacterized protein LOC118753053 [Rhagoletis pomonella]
MGRCAICHKRRERGTGPFFRVPAEESQRLLWGKNCGVHFKEKDSVCVDHFSRSDMIGGGKRSQLLPKAVPFPPSECPNTTATTTTNSNWTPSDHGNLFTDSYYAQLESDIGTSDSQAPEILDSPIFSQASPSPFLTNGTEKIVKNCQMLIDSYVSLTAATKKPAKDCQTQTEPIIMEALMGRDVYELKREVKKLKAENRDLAHQLNIANAVQNNFKQIFTENQMRKMISPDRNVKWSWNDISSALSLYAAGPVAYTYLYDKGYPLPHVSTLQRWFRQKDLEEGLSTTPSNYHDLDMPEPCHEDKTSLIPDFSDQK